MENIKLTETINDIFMEALPWVLVVLAVTIIGMNIYWYIKKKEM